MIGLLIADDHTLLSESLCMVFQDEQNIKVLATAKNGSEALEKCMLLKPDIVLMDIKMPVMNGLEATKQIKENCPDTKVIVMTSLEEGKSVISSIINGADAYILKDTPPEQLKVIINCIHWGLCIFSDSARLLLKNELMGCNSASDESETVKALKYEDIELIKYISEGKNNAEIGELLGYAQGTVKNKVTKLLELTSAESRAQLVMFALKNNIL